MNRLLLPAKKIICVGFFSFWATLAFAETTPCIDSADCQLGEVCVDEPRAAKGICKKSCSWPELNLEIDGTEDYVDSEGSPYRRYTLKAINWRSLPAHIFEAAPDLPACGDNPNASRSWTYVLDHATGNILKLFCDLHSTQELDGVWFSVPVGTQPPRQVKINVNDRRTGHLYCSNVVRIQTE